MISQLSLFIFTRLKGKTLISSAHVTIITGGYIANDNLLCINIPLMRHTIVLWILRFMDGCKRKRVRKNTVFFNTCSC